MKIAIFTLCLVAYSQDQDELISTQEEQRLNELDNQLNFAEVESSFTNLWTEAPSDEFKLVTKGFFGNTFTGWQIAGNKNGKYFSECGVRGLVGGYDVLGVNGAARVIEDQLPPHNKLKLSLRLFKIDEWGGAYIWVKLDGQDVFKQQWFANTGTGNICGNAGKIDGEFLVLAEVDHTAPTVTIQITTNLLKDANQASWGFREYQLSYK